MAEGAEVNLVGDGGDTPILMAFEHGHMDVARYLFTQGATDPRVQVLKNPIQPCSTGTKKPWLNPL